MLQLRAFAVLLVAFCAGCASLGTGAPAPSARLPLRLLSSEAPSAPRPEAAPDETHDDAPSETHGNALQRNVTAPRIGAPGGSGAGSRRVAPVQSGNETVGGLPVGTAGGTGPAGRG